MSDTAGYAAPAGRPRILAAGLPEGLRESLQTRWPAARIRWTVNALQTQSALQRETWDLLLLAHCPPACDAAAVLSYARAGLGLARLPVVLLLQSGDGGGFGSMLQNQLTPGEILVGAAGAEVVLDTIEDLLDGVREPRAASESDEGRRLTAAMDALWRRSKTGALDRLSELERAGRAAIAGELCEGLRDTAHRAAHGLAGSLATFGFAQGSVLARRAEELLGQPAGATAGEEILRLVVELRRELDSRSVQDV